MDEDEIKKAESLEESPKSDEGSLAEAGSEVSDKAPASASDDASIGDFGEPQGADTPSASPKEPASPEGEGIAPEEPPARTFTQEQVNELVGKARAEGRQKGMEQARADLMSRYGVDDDDQLDSIFRDGSRYGELGARYSDVGNQLRDAMTQIAMMKAKVLPERESDVKAILGAMGKDVTEESINEMLATHPEWVSAPESADDKGFSLPKKPIPQPTPGEGAEAGRLGVEPKAEEEESDEAKAMRLFNL
jgi:hypothetical protein